MSSALVARSRPISVYSGIAVGGCGGAVPFAWVLLHSPQINAPQVATCAAPAGHMLFSAYQA
jgi:hypothetical protein